MEEEEEDAFDTFDADAAGEPLEATYRNVLTDAEKNIAKTLMESGIRFIEIEGDYLKFSLNPKLTLGIAQTSRGVFLPRLDVSTLRDQIDEGVQQHGEFMGIAIPSLGYLELSIQNNGLYSSSLHGSISKLSPEGVPDCRHSNGDISLPCASVAEGGRRAVRLHIQGSHGGPCLELSGISPAGLLWSTRGRMRPTSMYNAAMSLKVHFPEAMDQQAMESSAKDIISSLIYELDVRNGLRLRTLRWPSKSRISATPREAMDTFARYPETRVNSEMSTLFGFAGSVIENPPLSFLSYYQVLEYYFPAAIKRTALRQLGKELSDPRFSRADRDDLLRILKIGERSLNATESSQLRTLLDECVRNERIESFFNEGNWSDHFSRNGPIQGVGVINTKNTQSPMANQVADRIYKIRNRIVHAKDDPKFEDVPALLPQSEEADALGPDIALARLLASEVILDSQTS